MTPKSHSRLKLLIPAGALVAAALVAAIAAWPGTAKTARTMSCDGALIAQVKQGLDAGLSLKGWYTLRIAPNGNFTGVLRTGKGNVPMTGQALGRAVNWIFTLPNKSHLYVAGTSLAPLKDCGSTKGGAHLWGTATGPRFGDLGVWADVTRGSRCCVIQT